MGKNDRNIKIGVVMVTYNRLDKLKVALTAYENQARKPDYIIVVDNHSSEDTEIFLDEWSKKCPIANNVIRTEENLGGAGGFYEGMRAALGEKLDWLWIADDDAFPEEHALEVLENYINNHSDAENKIAALCAKVEDDTSGRIDISHRCRIRKRSIQRLDF